MVGARNTSRNLVSTYSKASSEADYDPDAASTSTDNRYDSVWSQTDTRTQAKSTSLSASGVMVEDGKPTSKKSLGKVYYKLGKLPSLLLIDVDITTGVLEKTKVPIMDENGYRPLDKDGEAVLEDGKYVVNEDGRSLLDKDSAPVLDKNGTPVTQRDMVQSGRLREQALREYIDIEFTGLDIDQSKIAFDLEARSNQLDSVQGFAENIGQCSFPPRARFGRTSRLIIPVRNKSEVGMIFDKFDQSKDLTRVKKELPMAQKRDHPEKTDLTVRCNVVRQGILIDPLVWSSEDATPIQVEGMEDVIATYDSAVKKITNDGCLSDGTKHHAIKKAEAARESEEKKIMDEAREAEDVRRAKRNAHDLSRRSIQLLFQHHWDTKFPEHKASPRNTRDFLATHSDFLENKQTPWVKRGDRRIHRDAPWEYIVQYGPRFGEDLYLSFDYNLVPIINKDFSVAKYAAYHFPANHPTAPASMSQTLKKLLQGLYVRYPFAAQLKKHHALIAKPQTEEYEQTDDATTSDSLEEWDDATTSDSLEEWDDRTVSDDQTSLEGQASSDDQTTSDGQAMSDLATSNIHTESAYDADSEGQSAEEIKVDDDSECSSLLTRTYMIRDVKANSQVGLVAPTAGFGKEAKFLSVKKFIRKCQSALSTGLSNTALQHVDMLKDEFNHLPLADIGKNKPFWVPLDLLMFCGDQILPNLHHLTDEIKRLRKSLDPRTVSGLGRRLLDEYQKIDPEKLVFRYDNGIRDVISLPFLASGKATYEPLEYTPIHPESRPRLELTSGAPSPKISVVYITPDVHSPSTEQFLTDVRVALAREGEKPADERILHIDKEAGKISPKMENGEEAGEGVDKISAKAVKSGPELFRLQDLKNQHILDEIVPPTANVLIGIVDGHSMSQAKYRETVAEVKRLGDRRLGAVTICLNKQDLEDRFLRSSSPLFPLNVLRKMRFMLGLKNFKTETLDAHIRRHHQQGLILIGGHISQPASESTEYCPAVAALVMSKPDDPSFYRAAARVQPANKLYTQAYDNGILPEDACKAPRLKKHYHCEINHLEETLQAMFQTWREARDSSSSNSGPKKPRVVFYRDSCHEIDVIALQNEVKQIGEAYQKVFGRTEDVPVSYVTVMKNRHVHSPIPKDKVDKDGVSTPCFTFTTTEYPTENHSFDNRSTRKEDGAKFQYLVHSNGDGTNMTLSRLRELTALLNLSSQLCDYTSLALPVHYARKLARRTLSYYDYMSHKDLSNYPSLAKLTPYDSVTGEEQTNEMKQILQVIAKGWSWVRGDKTKKDRTDTQTRPWHKDLDDKMFFL